MIRKEVIQQLIKNFQDRHQPVLVTREDALPLHSRKVVVAKGVRRSGKSSAMLLAVDALLAEGTSIEKVLYLNFDDERLPFTAESFDLILQAYRELYPHIPMNEVYVFLDEVQQCTGWEQFVRRLYDQETQNVFITGSNARLLSSEIATSLRGRTLQFEYFPLSFSEYCNFKKLDSSYGSSRQNAMLQAAFNSYYQQGGFPELVLDDTPFRDKILQEYYHLMLYRDMVERYDIRNLPALRYFIRRLIVNISKPISIQKLFNELKSAGLAVSKNSLYEWIAQLDAIYLFLPLPKFEPSMVKEQSSEKKYYLIDNGLLRALSPQLSEGKGVMLENLVYLQLRRMADLSSQFFFYKGKKECDFVVARHQQVEQLVQVCWEVYEADTLKREIAGLLEAAKAINCNNLWLVTDHQEDEIQQEGYTIRMLPAWKFCLLHERKNQST
ncbi:MAG: ATP-binding protein [Bacteroidia bacterium]